MYLPFDLADHRGLLFHIQVVYPTVGRTILDNGWIPRSLLFFIFKTGSKLASIHGLEIRVEFPWESIPLAGENVQRNYIDFIQRYWHSCKTFWDICFFEMCCKCDQKPPQIFPFQEVKACSQSLFSLLSPLLRFPSRRPRHFRSKSRVSLCTFPGPSIPWNTSKLLLPLPTLRMKPWRFCVKINLPADRLHSLRDPCKTRTPGVPNILRWITHFAWYFSPIVSWQLLNFEPKGCNTQEMLCGILGYILVCPGKSRIENSHRKNRSQ